MINVQVEHAKKAGTVCLFYSIVLTKGIFKWDFIFWWNSDPKFFILE